MSAPPPPTARRAATADDAGRSCPYCRFALKEGTSIADCEGCHAPHHLDCWADNGGCAVVGCIGGPGTARAGGPAPAATPLRQRQAPSVPPGASVPRRAGANVPRPSRRRGPSRRPAPKASETRPRGALLPLAVCVLAVAVFGVAVALFLSKSSPKAQPQPKPAGTRATIASGGGPPAGPANARKPPVIGPAIAPGGPPVTGRDASNYNTGPGCSDNPQDVRPGCRDSPSVPTGDPEGSCPNSLVVDKQTTSCGLAEAVRHAFRRDGALTAYSPERRRSFPFSCFTAGPGTTGFRFCLGTADGQQLYVRWRP